MDVSFQPIRHALLRLAETGATLSARSHRVQPPGTEHLPAHEPVLLVGNQGLRGSESPAFLHPLHPATCLYLPRLAERGFHEVSRVRTGLPWQGGVGATREDAFTAFVGDFLQQHTRRAR